jgi:hypothetical protein
MTEFASNAATSTFIELFAFMTNYEFESRMSFDPPKSETSDRLSARKRVLTQKTITIIEKMKNIWDFTKKKLANTQEMQKNTQIDIERSHLNTNSKTWSDCSSRILESNDHSESWITNESNHIK